MGEAQESANVRDIYRLAGMASSLLREYADRAITGADSSRPQYREMLSAADRKEFDILIVDDLSRLARDQVESERVIRRLEFQGVRLVATADGYDSQTKTATRKIQRTVKGLVNEMRLDELREQVHRGLTGQAIKGYWCGGRVYGYALRPILDPNSRDPYGQPERIVTKLEIDAEQAAIVREIYRRYVDGDSCRIIAKDLNSLGVPSAGSTWNRKVRSIRVGYVGTSVVTFVIPTPPGACGGHVHKTSGWNTATKAYELSRTSCSRVHRSETAFARPVMRA
jgi:site-specific DNA recombinase